MSYYFLYPKQAPMILHIPNISKYLDLSESILCVSQIRDTGQISLSIPQTKSPFSSVLKFH